MEAKKKQFRVLNLNLHRQTKQLDTLLSKAMMDYETLSKAETIVSSDFAPLKKQYDAVVFEMVSELDDTDPQQNIYLDQLLTAQNTLRESFVAVNGKIRLFHKTLDSEDRRESLLPTTGSLNQSFSASSCQPKLEKIPIPKFDGDILKFRNFRALFENLVHNNSDLIPVQKLHYLKEAFVDSAKDIVRYFDLNAKSYEEAWSFVVARYSNPRSVVRALFRKLHYLEPIKNERGIRSLLDQVNVIIRALRSEGETIDDTFTRYIAYHVSIRLDPVTQKDWENSLKESKLFPKFEELEKFLQNRSFAIEDRMSEPNLLNHFKDLKFSSDKTVEKSKSQVVRSERKSFVTNKNLCVVYSQIHYLNQCKEFVAKSVADRFEIVKKNKLCIKCFGSSHNMLDCTRPNWYHCNGNHHYLLHREKTTVVSNPGTNLEGSITQPGITQASTLKKASLSTIASNKHIVLPTAVVKVQFGNRFACARVMFDSCSETTLVSRSFLKANNLRSYKSPILTELSGVIEGTNEILDSMVDLILQSRFSDFQHLIKAEVINRIPYNVNFGILDSLKAKFPNLEFGECKLSYTHADIIIGSEYYEHLIEEGRFFVEKLTLRKTKFGIVVSGSEIITAISTKLYSGITKVDIDYQIQKFWESEEIIGTSESKNQENILEYQITEEHFEKTFTYTENNRFCVRLPIKASIDSLHGSYTKALGILKKSEKYLPFETRQEYIKFMTEYEELGHMRKLSTSEVDKVRYFVPHQIVKKLSSTTTKYRVVFNASANDLSGTSLNSHLMVGPVLQPELFDTLVKFQVHRIAFCADIEKMYRNIVVQPEDRKYQCILWRSSPTEPVSHYELTTVTYGTAPASYLATKCLDVIARSLEKSNPIAADVIRSNFYMDDLITGSESVQGAVDLQRSVHSALIKHGFPLRKYQCNSSEFLNQIDSALVKNLNFRDFSSESYINLLGLMWCPKSDELCVVLNLESLPKVITKRILLSDISRIFDVLGILSPITVRAKIMLQNLWRKNLKWDDPISEHLQNKFLKYRDELSLLKDFRFPRPYSDLSNFKIKRIIGFCDASLKAYSAIFYMQCIDKYSNVSFRFICAKTKVAPLKPLTIPRLELQSAVLLSKLLDRLSSLLNIEPSNCFVFSDSTVVLNWLKHPIGSLKTYVANRVDKILKLVPLSCWNYINTECNPADLATRGLNVTKFLTNSLWLNGPEWLINNFEEYINVKFEESFDLPEIRNIKKLLLFIEVDVSILSKFSSYNKLVNVMAYVLRFFNNSRKINRSYNSIALTNDERNIAFNYLICLSQRHWYAKEFECLKNERNVKKGSSLRALDPFLDNNNIIRVGGRLKNSVFI